MAKFKYKLKHTGTTGKRIIRFSKTKEEAEKVKSFMLRANKSNIRSGEKPRFRNPRISKIRRSK